MNPHSPTGRASQKMPGIIQIWPTEFPHWSESSGSFFSLSGSLLTKIFALRSEKWRQWDTSKIQQLCWYKYKRHQTNCSFKRSKRSVIACLWPWHSENNIHFHLEGTFLTKWNVSFHHTSCYSKISVVTFPTFHRRFSTTKNTAFWGHQPALGFT